MDHLWKIICYLLKFGKKNKVVDKDLGLIENKTDDSNETETKQNQEEEKKVSNEEKVDDNLKSEEPKEK